MEGFDLSTIQGCYVGSTPATAIYIGSNLIWPSHDYSQDYLTFEAITAGTVTIKTYGDIPTTISYSTDNGSIWTDITSSTSEVSIGDFIAGDKILFKGENDSYCRAKYSIYNNFGGTASFNISGNIMSLIYGDNFEGQTSFPTGSYRNFCGLFAGTNIINAKNLILPATTLTSSCYDLLFGNCSLLVTPPELPATTLAYSCYSIMFQSCSSLLSVPELPATTLADYCYKGMFKGCTLLTTAPELPATTLANECYNEMFHLCTSLTAAPELPATTLTEWCYANMFGGCTNLNYVKCLATDISASNCTEDWLNGVSSTGTFISDPNTTWPEGSSGIPTGWTIEYIS